jgi:hypothetical protein
MNKNREFQNELEVPGYEPANPSTSANLNDPYFVKKTQAAQATLDEFPIPEEFFAFQDNETVSC